jgi:DNA-directed RNA polymerase subunit N
MFIGSNYTDFMAKKDGRPEYGTILDELGVKNLCCRRMLLTHVEIIEDTAIYSSISSVMDDSHTMFNAYVKKARRVSCD